MFLALLGQKYVHERHMTRAKRRNVDVDQAYQDIKTWIAHLERFFSSEYYKGLSLDQRKDKDGKRANRRLWDKVTDLLEEAERFRPGKTTEEIRQYIRKTLIKENSAHVIRLRAVSLNH
ncbi:hypothetical protein JCM3770_002504 [Rhodotorula araucariae]